MTVLTLGALVFVAQGKFGVLVMIERGGGPGTFVMASLAFFAQAAFMYIVWAMTGNTACSKFFFV